MVELKKLSGEGNPADDMATRISIIREMFGIDKTNSEEKSE